MPRTSSRKRNSRRIDSTVRVTSNLSPNAPEFIPIANDETTANQQRETVIRSVAFCASSSASNSSGNNSNSNYEASTIVSSIPDALKNKGQRDLLINLLNECRVDCVICYERAKNVEQIWNCRNCYQIMHLKCIIVWFIKSHRNAVWRCPACQSEVTGKPKYVCFCGTLPNPYHNNVDIPHSCGQVCGLQRKNSNLNYNDCHHKCTLLCHPGPCPQCVVQVLRSCGCGKKRVYAQCGQSTQIVCDNVCLKKLNCQIHACEKICHANSCEPCNKGCPQNLNPSEENLAIANARFADAILQYNLLPPESLVTEEELRMLGLNPEELFDQRNVPNSYYSTFHENGDANNIARNNEEFYLIDSDTDDDVVEDNMDDIMNTIHFGMNSNTFFLQHERPRYIGSDEIFENYPITDDSHDDVEEIEDDDDGGVGGGDISSSDNGEYSGCDSNNRSLTNSSNEDHEEIEIEISSPASNPSDRSWDMSESELVNPNSSYSEDSTDSSSDSDDSSSNNANSSTSTTSSSSSSSSSTSSSSRSSSRSSSSSSSSSSF